MLDRGSKKNVFSYFVILSNISKDGQLSNVFGSLLREVFNSFVSSNKSFDGRH